jgi:hypothetical protein
MLFNVFHLLHSLKHINEAFYSFKKKAKDESGVLNIIPKGMLFGFFPKSVEF